MEFVTITLTCKADNFIVPPTNKEVVANGRRAEHI
jgi:hypothetical protein